MRWITFMKKHKILLIALAILVVLSAGCGDDATEPTRPEIPLTLIQRLEALEGCTVVEIDPPSGAHFERAFQISMTQPVDHDNPDGPTFTQRMFLSHYSESAPMVLVTWGYDVLVTVPLSWQKCFKPTSYMWLTDTTETINPILSTGRIFPFNRPPATITA